MTNSNSLSPSNKLAALEISPLHTKMAFALGVYFSILQFNYFFLMEAYVSSRSISFFFVLFFWLIGFLVGLRFNHSNRMALLIGISISSYYVTWLVVKQNPYDYKNFLIVGIAGLLSGMAPGYYFIWAKDRFPHIKHLFFHENNGFILGIVISLIGALFAGAWLLNWGALLALIPAALLARSLKKASSIKDSGLAVKKDESPLLPYLQGFHFGTLQVALYLMVQVYYSASYIGYFLIVLAWMAGVIFGLKRMKRWQLHQAGYLSLMAYLLLLVCLSLFAPYAVLIPIIAILTACIALPVGILFREWRKKLSVTSLFLHENNGFILGYLISMLSFVQWGVHFLYLGPLLSFAVTKIIDHQTDGENNNSKMILLFFPATAIAAYFMGSTSVALVLLLVGFIGLFLSPKIYPQVAEKSLSDARSAWGDFSIYESRRILLLAGVCLLLLQYLITREFSTILAASELSILMVAIAYFCGLSVGYGMLRHLSLKLLQPLAVIMFVLHLLVLPIIKPLYGLLINLGWGFEVLWGLMFITAFFTSAFYSIILPRLIEAKGSDSLADAYSWDLLGAALAVVIMVFFTYLWPAAIWPLYLMGMALLIASLLKGTRYDQSFLAVALAVISLFTFYQKEIFTATTEDYYHSRGYDNPKLLFSQNSLYHGIDIIESYRDKEQTQLQSRTSFLNGVGYFRQKFSTDNTTALNTGLSEFTYYLAELPAKFLAEREQRKLRVLILGAGSMSSMKRVRPYSSKTTLVEIDSLVVKSGQEYWSDVNGFAGTEANEEIIIDDAKHYLMTTQEKFDLIIMDISAPYYLGTMLLHNREFFRLVRSRLKRNGLFSESTQSRPKATSYDSTAMRILGAVDSVFPYWNLISTRKTQNTRRGSHGYVYAFRKEVSSSKSLIDYLKRDGYRAGSHVYSSYSKRFKLQHVEPFSLTNMNSLLTANQSRISRRLKLKRDVNVNVQLNKIKKMDFSTLDLLNRVRHSFLFWLSLLVLLLLSWFFVRPRVQEQPQYLHEDKS